MPTRVGNRLALELCRNIIAIDPDITVTPNSGETRRSPYVCVLRFKRKQNAIVPVCSAKSNSYNRVFLNVVLSERPCAQREFGNLLIPYPDVDCRDVGHFCVP